MYCTSCTLVMYLAICKYDHNIICKYDHWLVPNEKDIAHRLLPRKLVEEGKKDLPVVCRIPLKQEEMGYDEGKKRD